MFFLGTIYIMLLAKKLNKNVDLYDIYLDKVEFRIIITIYYGSRNVTEIK